ncbi:MAG: hypothetical protein F6K19_21795 [Cyanothece sp. SIO1E1]|nr:hypothetical protein [Cyanothece sp. SIO1E1]
MQFPSEHIKELYDAACQYLANEDPYHAVKLYKKIIRLAPDWAPPYVRLGHFYKQRWEWKPALHYNKKAVALNPTDRECWWNMGIAATALNRPRIARRVWKKFGLEDKKGPLSCLRISYDRQFEILLIQIDSPASATILNVPHPKSDYKYKDRVLFDKEITGYTISNGRKVPVYDELGLLKRSTYFTYSCILPDADSADIDKLDLLCKDYGLGFEVWSNSSRSYTVTNADEPSEYYDGSIFPKDTPGALVAIASRREATVVQVLEAWKIISLKNYEELEGHN